MSAANQPTLSLRPATMDDWNILLEWRNDEATRMNSHNTALVQEDDHKKWLQSVIDNKERLLYICERGNEPAGSVRADWDEAAQAYELSWTIAPNHRGMGIGKEMVKMLADQLTQKLRAEVKVGNTGSVKIAEYAGLSLVREENGVLYFEN